MDIREKAEKLHKSGFNCAQSVLGACGEYTGLDENTALAVSAGFGGGVRNVISKVNPIAVNKALKDGKILYTICGRPVHIWEGGGITAECSVDDCPEGAFSWVPTPAGVTPLEVTMTKETYQEIGGYMDAIRPVDEIKKTERTKTISLNK